MASGGIFSGCTIAFAGLYHSLIKVKREIKHQGGNVSSLCPTVTHLVTTEDQLETSTVERAQQYNAFVVSEAWVKDSIEQGARLDEKSYFLGEKQPDSAIAQEKATISSKATEALRSSISDFPTYSASPLLLQPSLLETSYGSKPEAKAIPFQQEPEHTTFYFSTSQQPEPEPEPEIAPEPTTQFAAPASEASSGESPLPQWVPFKTTRKIKSRTFRVNQKQPVLYSETKILAETTLQLSNLGNNNNKYYALELHENPNGKSLRYRIFCHYGRTCDIANNPSAGQRCYRYFNTLDDARTCFQNLYDEKTKKGYRPLQLLSSNIGSETAQALRLAALSSAPTPSSEPAAPSTLPPQLQTLISNLYEEASNAITASVNAKITSRGIETALGVLTKRQVQAGEDILMRIKRELDNNSTSQLEKLCNEFYSLIPHKIGRDAASRKSSLIDSMGKLEQKLELLQLMKDMLDLISAGGVGNVVDMQYKALKTNLVPLDKNSSNFVDVEAFVLGTQTTPTSSFEIANIFAIKRPSEKLYSAIGNIQLQFHGSRACNFVGLLSRGILMPKVVVSRGGGRTDAGLLGNGIYFSDSFTTAAQYAYPNAQGSRFVLANRVALGRCRDYTETQIGMAKPPFGYHSVHGVSQQQDSSSAFKDNEYVVFDTNQQVQEYLIEFKPTQSTSRVIPVSTPSPLPESFFSMKHTRPVAAAQASVRAPAQTFTVNPPEPSPSAIAMSNEQIKSDEEKYRTMFVQDKYNHELQNPHLNLIDVMANISTFKYQQLSNEEQSWTTLLTKHAEAVRPGSLSVVPTQSKFLENWAALTENQFKGLNWSNVFVAGGAILACLQPDFTTNLEVSNPYYETDIDIFVYGLSPFEATEKLRHIQETVQRNTNGSGKVIRSKYAITILGEYPYRHTQVILRIYKSPAEILMGFDIDCCGVGFDGSRVFAVPRARRALTKKFNLVDLSRRSLTYEKRLTKYSRRGFVVKIPFNVDLNRVSQNLYQRRSGEVQGLAKLLLMHNIQQTGKIAHYSGPSLTAPPGSDSDYNDVELPWGPNWFINQIIATIGLRNTELIKNVSLDCHTFVTDISGAISGWRRGNCLCEPCQKGTVTSQQGDTCGSLRWVEENPSRQILTGSFHPVSDNEWTTDAYKSWPEIPGVHFRNVSGTKKTKATATKGAPKVTATKVATKTKVAKVARPRKAARMAMPATPSTLAAATGGAQPMFAQSSTFGNVQPTPTAQPMFGGVNQPIFGGTQPTFGGTPSSSALGQGMGHVVFGKTENLQQIVTKVQPSGSLSSNFAETVQPQSDVSKLLLLVGQLYRDGLLTNEEKSTIKNLIIRRNATVISALEVFEIERDFNELADSFRRICRYNQ